MINRAKMINATEKAAITKLFQDIYDNSYLFESKVQPFFANEANILVDDYEPDNFTNAIDWVYKDFTDTISSPITKQIMVASSLTPKKYVAKVQHKFKEVANTFKTVHMIKHYQMKLVTYSFGNLYLVSLIVTNITQPIGVRLGLLLINSSKVYKKLSDILLRKLASCYYVLNLDHAVDSFMDNIIQLDDTYTKDQLRAKISDMYYEAVIKAMDLVTDTYSPDISNVVSEKRMAIHLGLFYAIEDVQRMINVQSIDRIANLMRKPDNQDFEGMKHVVRYLADKL